MPRFLFALPAAGGCANPLPDLGDDSTDASDGAATSSIGDTASISGTDGETGPGDGTADTTAGEVATTDATTADTTGGESSCAFLCGSSLDCCQADEECLEGSCVAACSADVRCGEALDACCVDGQLCLGSECVDGEGSCIDDFDCAEGSFCMLGQQRCFPRPRLPICEVVPDFLDIELALEWSFEEEQIISMPAVGDIDGDMQPEVVVSTYYATDPGGSSLEFYGEIIVFDGTNGQQQFTIPHDPTNGDYGSYSRSTVGISDVDDDGVADVVYVGRPEVNIPPFTNNSSLVHAINGLGQHLWASHAPDGTPHYIYIRHGAPSFANFDDDEASEIVFGSTVLDNDGTVVFDQSNEWMRGGGVFGSNGDYLGGISAIADLTGDGYPEIISGRQAWSVSWDQPAMGAPDVQLTLLWEYIGPDGYPAIADLDQDGDPEVVLVGDPGPFGSGQVLDGQVIVLDGATGQLWCGVDPTDALCQADPNLRTAPIYIPGGGRGGPPTIADLDGDGRPEIGVAGGSTYSVYDLNRMGEVVVVPAGNPPPGTGDIYVRWSAVTQDQSSNTTGSSAFDFQGDGINEVIYHDECYARVFAGDTGYLFLEVPNSSATIHEYPIVVDVDGDGRSELLVVANDVYASGDCTEPGYTPRRGLFVYGGFDQQWARTRRVWSSHGYHVTNATSDGRVPSMEAPHWSIDELNGYRSNVATVDAFHAPDLRVDLAVDASRCGDGEITVQAIIRNSGTAVAPAGIVATLYEGPDASGTQIDTRVRASPLDPGGSTIVSWVLPAPREPTNFFVMVDGAIIQCDETNDSSVLGPVSCR